MERQKYNYHKYRSYLIVFGILTLSFVLVFRGFIFISKTHPDYPLVFTDANNRLMFITKSNNNKNDIASISNASIVYANSNTRYLLYTNNNALFLLDTTVGGTGTKISNNVLSYGFSVDDKYVYYIDNNNDFFVYGRNDNKKIKMADKVNKVELVKDNHLIYNQSGKLIYQELNSNPVVVSDNYLTVELNKDSKLILYSVINEDLKDYYIYDITNNERKIVLDGITKLYTKDNNFTKFIYTTPSNTVKDVSNALRDEYYYTDKNYHSYEYTDFTSGRVNKAQYEANQFLGKQIDFRNELRNYVKNYGKLGNDLYYKNNDTISLVAANINKLYYYDLKNQVYSYTTYAFENNVIDISNYKDDDIEKFYSDFDAARLNSMYYKSGNASPTMTYKNVTGTAKVDIRNNDYYLFVENNELFNLYHSKITNRSAKLVGEIDHNLLLSRFVDDYSDGCLYFTKKDDKYILNVVNEGKNKVLAEDVNPKYLAVSEGKDSIYYLKVTGDNICDLNLYNGIRTSKLADNVYSFMYINNDLIYVTKDYKTLSNTSDLYRLDGNHLTFIYKDIADWYSPLKDDIEEEQTEEDI